MIAKSTVNIYTQKSSAIQAETKMVKLATIREFLCDQLEDIIRCVKEKRRVCDDDCIFETIKLMNSTRLATIDVIEAIFDWQQGFTKVVRPQLLECDYLIMLVKRMDFVNATNLRRIFNFQVGRGNLFILPLPNPRTIEPNIANQSLAEEIRKFAMPPIDRLVTCYQILINCIPTPTFEKILPIAQWLQDRWIPKIQLDWDVHKTTKNTLLQLQPDLQTVTDSKRTKVYSKPSKHTSSVIAKKGKKDSSKKLKKPSDNPQPEIELATEFSPQADLQAPEEEHLLLIKAGKKFRKTLPSIVTDFDKISKITEKLLPQTPKLKSTQSILFKPVGAVYVQPDEHGIIIASKGTAAITVASVIDGTSVRPNTGSEARDKVQGKAVDADKTQALTAIRQHKGDPVGLKQETLISNGRKDVAHSDQEIKKQGTVGVAAVDAHNQRPHTGQTVEALSRFGHKKETPKQEKLTIEERVARMKISTMIMREHFADNG